MQKEFQLLFGVMVMITVGFFLLIGLMCGMGTFATASGEHQRVATMAAEDWADWARPGSDVDIRCASTDSDGDGYISCTVKADGVLIPLECQGAYTIGDGCRTVLRTTSFE